MRAHDWSKSSLGPPDQWPQSLRSVVGLLLQSKFPMFVAWGRDLAFLYNDPYAEILGAKHPAALGSRFYDIWAEIWSDISPLIDAAMSGQASYREDLPLVMNRRGFDEQTWFTFSYSPVRDESGQVAGMFCAVSETTRRVLAERALRELNETLERRVAETLAERKLLADIVEGTDAAVQVIDLEFRWLGFNRAAANQFVRLFGRQPKVGDSVLEVLAHLPEEQARIRAVWTRALAGEEFTEVSEHGAVERRAYEMKFNTLRDHEGRQIGAYQFVYDVTERLRDQKKLRAAEEALLQAQKMESIGQLTGGVAHDFNNLLAVVSGGLQVLQRQDEPEQRRRVMDGMQRAVDRGTALTRHLLAFARKRPVQPESIDLASLISGMRELLTRSLRGDVHVAMQFSHDLWNVTADAGEAELAILNLCVNARDAMPEGGTISVVGENVTGDRESALPGEYVRLSIKDNGTGMPPEVLARVFEPFYTTKDVGKGSGLGLAQVYGFAQQSGGRVNIESRLGHGTTVTLLLPRTHAGAAATVSDKVLPPGTSAELRDGERAHVLLVEDDGEVAALTVEMLGSINFRVTHVSTAAAALQSLNGVSAVDIVVSDIMMPGGMNGLELAQVIRRQRPSLPIILTTGYPEAAAGAQQQGFGILFKPYRIETLSNLLTEFLAPRQPAARSASF